MQKYHLFLLVLVTRTVLASSGVSGVFALNTFGLIGQDQSATFACATDQFIEHVTSSVFVCETDHLWSQDASPIFLCDSQSPKFGSAIFLADTHTIPVDSDGNGLPNIWEMIYFNATTGTVATADDDEDGSNNIDEYISGTNPRDENSIFVVYIDGNDGFVEWLTVLRRLYTLQYTANLTNSFSDVSGCIDVPGTGHMDYYPGISEDSNGFYRVKVRLEE